MIGPFGVDAGLGAEAGTLGALGPRLPRLGVDPRLKAEDDGGWSGLWCPMDTAGERDAGHCARLGGIGRSSLRRNRGTPVL